MLNVIFSILNIEFIEEQTVYFVKNYNFVTQLPESRKVGGRIMCQGNVIGINDLEVVKTLLQDIGANPSIIGVWELQSGDQIDIPYPFDITEYTNYLYDVYTFDDEGVIISNRRPTEAEARNTQVNLWAGMPYRDLGE